MMNKFIISIIFIFFSITSYSALASIDEGSALVCLPGDLYNKNTGVPCPIITPIINRTLKIISPRMEGLDVSNLQAYLNMYGYSESPLVVDGVFGTKTKLAVVAFQEINELFPDGAVGPLTIDIINKKKNEILNKPIVLLSGVIRRKNTIITNSVIAGVGIPVLGEIPTSNIAETEEYTATISWSGNPNVFNPGISYVATITFTPKNGFTLKGINENFFSVNGAITNNFANQGIITASFPATEMPIMNGEISITGSEKFGQELVVDVSNINYIPTLISPDIITYEWNRDGVIINGATSASYTLREEDIGHNMTVVINSDGINATGSKTSLATGIINKADGPTTPSAPTEASKTSTSISLSPNTTYEFSQDGINWQDSEVFTGLTPSTLYTFVCRIKETSTTYASLVSDSLGITTNDPPTFTISGLINYDNLSNSPVHNVTIYLKQNGNTIYTTTTTETGPATYNFSNVLAGTYEIYFSTFSPVGGISSTDAGRLSYFLSNPTVLSGIKILSGDVYDNSPSTIITSEDAQAIQLYYVYGTPFSPGKWVFAKSENKTTSYNNFPIPYAAASETPGFSNMTITVGDTNIVQDFTALVYGDPYTSFTPQ